MPHPKKVGKLPVGGSEKFKQTNEIKTASLLLDSINIAGLLITADALLTQREFASYLVGRLAHYLFTVKGNQSSLMADLEFFFCDRRKADAKDINHGHGRIETRRIWTTSELNGYLDFPHVGQAFAIERETVDKKTGKVSRETIYGVTSLTHEQADAARLLKHNRGHWCIENSCHYILDWNWDEDRGCIRTGYGPENISRLRRFAIGVIKGQLAKMKHPDTVAQKTRDLAGNVRLVFDYLKMTENSRRSRSQVRTN